MHGDFPLNQEIVGVMDDAVHYYCPGDRDLVNIPQQKHHQSGRPAPPVRANSTGRPQESTRVSQHVRDSLLVVRQSVLPRIHVRRVDDSAIGVATD